jgi:hypothetical protein
MPEQDGIDRYFERTPDEHAALPPGSGLISGEEIEARKKAAERGWLADPPPRPPREMIPEEENKWYLMMGSRRLLDKKRERERRAVQEIADRRHKVGDPPTEKPHSWGRVPGSA